MSASPRDTDTDTDADAEPTGMYLRRLLN
ncbi:hypothetical protein MNBD_GAMMA10-810, partial [hydrothermal vent metagenome]